MMGGCNDVHGPGLEKVEIEFCESPSVSDERNNLVHERLDTKLERLICDVTRLVEVQREERETLAQAQAARHYELLASVQGLPSLAGHLTAPLGMHHIQAAVAATSRGATCCPSHGASKADSVVLEESLFAQRLSSSFRQAHV